MKNAFYLMLIVALFSCRKENLNPENDKNLLLMDLKHYVAQNTTPQRYDSIMWQSTTSIIQGDATIGYVALCRRESDYTRRLVALYKNGQWECTFQDISGGTDSAGRFSGELAGESLDGRQYQLLQVKNNNTQRLRSFSNGQLVKDITSVAPSETGREIRYFVLPPGVIIINRGLYYWVNHTGSWGSGDSSGVQQSVVSYLNADGPGSGEGGGNDDFSELVEVELDDSDSEPGINIDDYFKCFSDMSSNGAFYYAKIYVDIPVDGNPDANISISNNSGISVGHTFIKLTKVNGQDTVNQVIGFYPKNGTKSMSMQQVESKIVDNGFIGRQHELNASMVIDTISEVNFSLLIQKLKEGSQKKYKLDDFNCTQFVLDAVNAIRSRPIACIPRFVDTYLGSRVMLYTPQGLYQGLQYMKMTEPADAPYISLDLNLIATASKGPCN